MNYINLTSALMFSIALASSSAMANEPPTTKIGCSKKADSAFISFSAVAWTSVDSRYQSTCPLLEEKELRKLVDKFAVGTEFAYPGTEYSCLSAQNINGTIEINDEIINIDASSSYSESAQRLFPRPEAQEDDTSLFAVSDDGTLQAGAAMTAVHLEAGDYTFDLLVDDHYLVTNFGEDTEDFSIVGSKGYYNVSGRLIGKGQIISQTPLLGIQFNVTGNVCLE